jgi:ribosome-associated protein
MKADIDPALNPFISVIQEKKAVDVRLLDVRGLTSVADYFFILSGRSHRQVTALAEHIVSSLRDLKIKPLGVEGIQEGHWALLDYGDVIVHVFFTELREFYDLDGLWIDAKRLNLGSAADADDDGLITEEADDEA